MISFEMPERIKNELQMAEMVARQVMRPTRANTTCTSTMAGRVYQRHVAGIARQNRRRFEKQMQQNGNGDRPQREGPNWSIVRLIAMVEMLSWGDAGMYLCARPAAGRRCHRGRRHAGTESALPEEVW